MFSSRNSVLFYDQFAISWNKVKVVAACSKMSKVLIEEIITILWIC